MSAVSLGAAFRRHRRELWGLCYRMTGSAADADELVQETFQRALERPPPDTTRPWAPWLMKVAVNLSRDRLRRRKASSYTGPWLPTPVESAELELSAVESSPTQRYEIFESATFAFLTALEALTPQKRAVLILRDVFDQSVKDVAEALSISEANVKTTHHRARREMASYESRRSPEPTPKRRVQEVLGQLMTALSRGDAAAMAQLLSEDVSAVTDGAGEFHAALNPIFGRQKVVRFFFGLLKKRGFPDNVVLLDVNGLPALLIEFFTPAEGEAPRVVIRVELDANGLVNEVQSILATQKLKSLQNH